MIWAKWHPDSLPSEGFAGKTVIVTGSNTGLGLSINDAVKERSIAH